MRNYKISILVMTVALSFVVACGEPVPVKQMVGARKAIAKAVSVKADKYAPKELEKAKAELLKSHDKVVDEKMDKAKIAANESKKAADEAFNKSVPLLARDTIEAAEQSLNMAVEAYAEELAKDDYAEAKAALEKANKLNGEKKYYDAYKMALEADGKAKNARNIALGQKDKLKDAIDEVKVTVKRSKEYDGEKHSPEKIKLAEENIAIAEEAYNGLQLKKGFSAVEVAKLNADEAYGQSLDGSAKTEYANAEVMIDKAEKSEGAGVAKDELAAARESLKNAKARLEDKNFKESIDYSKETTRLASIVMVTKKPAEVADKGTEKNIEGKDVSGGKDSTDVDGKDEGSADYFLYTVVRRKVKTDCLWRIAARFYKQPRKWPVIYKANKDRIRNPHLIYPGWVLKVPKIEK